MSLQRFHDAQAGGVWERALDELTAGRKQTHWMWFIFPQLRGLGRSERARYYGLADIAEARAYLADPVLRGRLEACAGAVLQHPDLPADAIMGPVDALKLQSCATLFEAADGGTVWSEILSVFYGGDRCRSTLALLSGQPN